MLLRCYLDHGVRKIMTLKHSPGGAAYWPNLGPSVDFLWRGVDGGGGPTIISILAKHTETIWVYCTLKQRGNHTSFFFFLFFVHYTEIICTCISVRTLNDITHPPAPYLNHHQYPSPVPVLTITLKPSFNAHTALSKYKALFFFFLHKFAQSVSEKHIVACTGTHTYTDTQGQAYSGMQTFGHQGSKFLFMRTGKRGEAKMSPKCIKLQMTHYRYI